ncbi:serine hydrolase [Sinosporangium siamense]|uniref:Serine hydrolase n=1 Tax=Sinosporangium siamense TaxID=1367973 RepID=A0A919V7C5_9ACTN|nr:serine hydrolase [Sinosporangium siamense]
MRRDGPTSVGPDLPEVERLVAARLGNFAKVPGCALAITKQGRIVWARAYGQRDLRAGRPFTLQTTHNIASITKTYMATLVLTLVDKQLIDLDADVNDYLPYKLRSPFFSAVPITLRMMLSHTSGLAEVGPEPGPYADSYRAGDLPARDGEWARRCLAQRNHARHYVYPPETGFWLRDARPGQVRSYSNLAWQPMTDVIKHVTGRDVHDKMRAALLKPLAIGDSGFRLADADTEPALGYAAVVDGKVHNGLDFDYEYLYSRLEGSPEVKGFVEYARYTYDVFADGGMRTSLLSLAKYSAMWANGGALPGGRRVLSPSAVTAAFTLQAGEGQGTADHGQGLGWGVSSRRPDGWVHGGGDLGTNTFALVLPKTQATVVAISNVSRFPGGIDDLVFDVAERAGV